MSAFDETDAVMAHWSKLKRAANAAIANGTAGPEMTPQPMANSNMSRGSSPPAQAPTMDAVEAVVEAMARFAYEDAYPGKPWGMADGFTQAMFRGRCAYYAPAALAAARPFIAAECAMVAAEYGPSRPRANPFVSIIQAGRWEGEQAASANIAIRIKETIR